MQWNWPSRSRRGRHSTQAPALVAKNDARAAENTAPLTLAANDVMAGAVVEISSELYAVAVPVGSRLHEQARRLQEQRFAQLQVGTDVTPHADGGYVETTDYAPERTVPIVVRRRLAGAAPSDNDPLVMTLRVELPGATMIEDVIQLRPESILGTALKRGSAAEIGGLAAIPLLDRLTLVDGLDGIASIIVQTAKERGIEHLMIFPRNGFMSLLLAEIPGVLPPFQFTLSPDVIGWNETSLRLGHFRALGMRGLGKHPDIYSVSMAEFERNLANRMALREVRQTSPQDFAAQFAAAMIQARRHLAAEVKSMFPQRVLTSYGTASSAAVSTEASIAGKGSQHSSGIPAGDEESRITGPRSPREGFLPFANSKATADYLRDVVERGGPGAQVYKNLSYDLLDIQPGMHVLDIGCGAGVDLPALSERVGQKGVVVGVDVNPALVREAKTAIAARGLENVWIYEGDGQHLRFSAAEFDRVRIDRTLQHVPHPERVIEECARVLQPEGILTVVEPDWATIAISPPGPNGLDDDTCLRQTVDWCRRHLAHALIGRSLHSLLQNAGGADWASARVDVVPFTLQQWEALDLVLQLSRAAHALMDELPDMREPITRWLANVQEADERNEFFALVPLFFGYARKASASLPRGE